MFHVMPGFAIFGLRLLPREDPLVIQEILRRAPLY